MNKDDKNWILNYLSSGKSAVPYEKMKSYESLNLKPEGEFFNKIDFYSSLKNKIVSDKEYNEVTTIFALLKMRNKGDLDDLYNFQDTIIL